MIGQQDRVLMIKEFTHPVMGKCGVVKQLCGNPNFVKIVFDEPYNKKLVWYSKYHLGADVKELINIVKNEVGATDKEVGRLTHISLPGLRVPNGLNEVYNGRALVKADKYSIQKKLRELSGRYYHALSIQRDFILSVKRLVKTEVEEIRKRIETICEAVDEEVLWM